MKSRTVQIFEEYIQTEKTREQYTHHLNRFINHFNLESFDAVSALESDDLKEKLEGHAISFKNLGRSSNYE